LPDFFLFTARKESVQECKKLLCAYFISRERSGNGGKKIQKIAQVIEKMSRAGSRVVDIATTLGVHRDTIYKEYARCGATPDTYSAEKAQETL